MPKENKKFKIFTHHYLYIRPNLGELKNPKTGRINAFLKILWQGLFFVSFQTGLTILKILRATLIFLVKELAKTEKYFARRVKILKQRQFYFSLGFFIIVCLITVAGFQSAKIVALGLEVKDRVLNIAFSGVGHLQDAKEALGQMQLEQAQNQFSISYRSFKTSQEQLKSAGGLISGLLNFLPQKQDADRVLDAASRISRAGSDLIAFYQQISGLKFTPQGLVAGTKPPAEVLRDSSALLGSIYDNIDKASAEISQVDVKNIPAKNREDFFSLKEKLSMAKQGLRAFQEICSLGNLLADGKKNVLLLFENNNELRAGGGFIGTYGKMQLDSGQIKNIKISSVYDLDGQLAEKIVPPQPMLNVNDRWYLRDANWFANFPDSASKISGFYEKEGEETPDLVIAITPSLIVDLLKITGPVDLPSHQLTVDSDNFVELMQYNSTLTTAIFQNNPKQALADFFPALLQKLSKLEGADFAVVLETLQKNLNAKQMVFYSRDSKLQKTFQEFHWDGSVSGSDRDYLSVVSSNLGGTKTDLYIKGQVNLKSGIGPDGFVTNELTITRTNTLPTLAETGNISFIRVLVPKGSKLISNIGFDFKDGLVVPTAKDYKIDAQVHDWESKSVKDLTTGTIIGEEAGKTFFGNWLSLAGGQSKTVKIVYTLPFAVKDVDHYSLLLQKQIGSTVTNFNYELSFAGRSLEWKNLNDGGLQAGFFKNQLAIDKDYFLGFVFSK